MGEGKKSSPIVYKEKTEPEKNTPAKEDKSETQELLRQLREM